MGVTECCVTGISYRSYASQPYTVPPSRVFESNICRLLSFRCLPLVDFSGARVCDDGILGCWNCFHSWNFKSWLHLNENRCGWVPPPPSQSIPPTITKCPLKFVVWKPIRLHQIRETFTWSEVNSVSSKQWTWRAAGITSGDITVAIGSLYYFCKLSAAVFVCRADFFVGSHSIQIRAGDCSGLWSVLILFIRGSPLVDTHILSTCTLLLHLIWDFHFSLLLGNVLKRIKNQIEGLLSFFFGSVQGAIKTVVAYLRLSR